MGANTRAIDEDRLQSLAKQFLEVMADSSNSVSIGYLVKHTDAENRSEAKQVLRKIMDDSQVTTTPDWEYKLASHVKQPA